MAKYVRIIDCGECFSTGSLSVNGVPANKSEWAKYNFYPQNGMVGELLTINGCSVLRIMDGVYVQMTENGYTEITYEDYKKGQVNNVCTGMDDRQRRINEQADELIAQLRRFGL